MVVVVSQSDINWLLNHDRRFTVLSRKLARIPFVGDQYEYTIKVAAEQLSGLPWSIWA